MPLKEIKRRLEELRAANIELNQIIAREHNTNTQSNVITVLNRVAVRLSLFWADIPSLLFSQTESQFLISVLVLMKQNFITSWHN